MKFRISLLAAISTIACLGFFAQASAASLDLDGLVAAGPKPTASGSETSVISDDEEKELFKKQEVTKEQAAKEAKEKEALTKNLNYLLIQAYKGKVDRIFGNLRENIDQYPPEVQIRIFRQVSDSVRTKLETIEEKGTEIGANRKQVLASVLEYIRSLVNANIARVQKGK